MRVFALAALVACTLASLGAQPSPTIAGPAASYLDVLRARGELRHASTDLARADALAARAMIAPTEHDERRATYERARLAYLGALIAANGATHLVVVRAVKSRTTDGRLRVTVTVRNGAIAPASDAGDSADVELTELATARAVTIALKADAGANGTTISRPYERVVAAFAPGAERDIAFELLEDATDVVVAVDGGGRVDERRVRLEVAAPPNTLSIDAAQSSLAGDLGAQVVYDLRIDRPRPRRGAARLSVRGLPDEAVHEFRDPDGRTRLAQLRFADGATTTRVQLAVSLPARPSAALRADVPLAFDVIATDEASDAGPTAEGRTRLELVPRGVARLELRPSALALEAVDRGATSLAITVRNAGTGRIDDVRLRAEPPARWQASIEPATLATLAAGEERRVRVLVTPPVDADVGDYELRIGVDDAGSARRIEVEDKLIRVRLGGAGLAGPVLGVVGVIALVAFVIVKGRRWVER